MGVNVKMQYAKDIKITRWIISICLGWCIGLLLSFLIWQRICSTISKGPDTNVVKTKIYFDEDTHKYWKFEPIPYVCPTFLKKVNQKQF